MVRAVPTMIITFSSIVYPPVGIVVFILKQFLKETFHYVACVFCSRIEREIINFKEILGAYVLLKLYIISLYFPRCFYMCDLLDFSS